MAKRPLFRSGWGFWTAWLLSMPLLLACLAYYWLFWPVLDILSIGAPLLLIWNTLLTFYWAWRKSYRFVIPLIPLMLALFVFEPVWKPGNPARKLGEGVKVLTYNTRYYDAYGSRGSDASRENFYRFLQSEDADILCLQEVSLLALSQIEGYPYRHSTPRKSDYANQAILSRYPLVRTGDLLFSDTKNNTLFADVAIDRDTIRIYNVHLESYKIASRRFVYEDYGTPFLQRVGEVAMKHRAQADRIRVHRGDSPYPSLVCGDFNATAFSNTYRRMQQGLNDTFSRAGKGVGTTYYLKGFPYRIDYILAHPGFEIRDHQTHDLPYSDHLPVSAVLGLPGQ